MIARPRKPVRALVLLVTLPALALFVLLTAGWARLAVLGTAAAISLLPPVNRRVGDLLVRGTRLSPGARRRCFVAVAVIASSYLAATALRQHRPLAPLIHDEFSYLIQSRMLAHGHLYQPRHPVADFFESFHILVKPVYASIYFPGTAMFYVPAIWLRCQPWVFSVAIYGLVAALTYLIAAVLLDDLAGLIAALLLLGTPLFRTYSVYVLGQGPASLLGLMMIWGWLHWRCRRGLIWALLIGVCAGWLAITRPVDAVAFAVPIGIAMVRDLARDSWGRRWRTAGIVFAASVPFLALQAHFDRAVTGSPVKTPYVLYLEQNQPGSTFGFTSGGPNARPASALPQKLDYLNRLAPLQSNHHFGQLAAMTIERLAGVTFTALCSNLLIPLALIGLAVGFALPDHRWRTLFAIAALFFALYLLNPVLLQHYAIPMVPIAATAVVLGVRVVSRRIASEYGRRFASTALTMATVALALAALPELDRRVRDELPRRFQLDRIDQALRTQVKAPAVVLFRYAPPADCLQEPVYNIDVVWPDDAPIIRAHDLGARDREIGAYYAARQPWRHFYLYDRGDNTLHNLGTAADVAAGASVAR